MMDAKGSSTRFHQALATTALVIMIILANAEGLRRHLLDLQQTRFHKMRHLLRTHSRSPEAFRTLTSTNLTRMQVDYGSYDHLLEGYEQHGRKTQDDRPVINVNYPIHIVPFKPLRITFIDDPIQSLVGTGSTAQDDYIHYILNSILPEARQRWQVHLSYTPLTTNLPIPQDTCWGMYSDYLTSVSNSGSPSTDTAIIVSMQKDLITGTGVTINVCNDPDTLLVSTFCAIEQFDRPVIGLFNFCPLEQVNVTVPTRNLQEQSSYPSFEDHWQTIPPISNNTDSSTFNQDDLLIATIHNMGNVLAMNYDIYRLFHDTNTGDPLTNDYIPKTAICSDFSHQIVEVPASNTFVSTENNGTIHFELVTNRVQTIVQSHFNCPTLTGARLENDPSQPGCVAGHWNERLFLGELMTRLSIHTKGDISALTLALFEDSGFYKVSYRDTFLPYGQGWGCDFVNGDCIVNDQVPSYGKDVYCSTPTVVESDGTISLEKNDIFCDPLHERWALCDLVDKSKVPKGFIKSGNSTKSYFSDTNLVSTTDGFDSCPLPVLSLDVNCQDANTSLLGIHYKGETYGASSRCINAELNSTKRKIPACFSIRCDATNFQVVVNGIICQYDGEVHTIQAIRGDGVATFTCPRLSLVCPQLFCPSDCSGRGTCDYTKRRPQCDCANNSTSTNCQFADDVVTAYPSAKPVATPPQSPNKALSPTTTTTTTTMQPTVTGGSATSTAGDTARRRRPALQTTLSWIIVPMFMMTTSTLLRIAGAIHGG